jgi:endonuclease-3
MRYKLIEVIMPTKKEKERAKTIFDILAKVYPNPRPALIYNSPFELLIATILSAQTTDDNVNKVTENLFKKYKTPEDYVNTPLEELQQDIFSTGFYKNKAKNLKGCCAALIEKFNKEVPTELDELVKLPGVGRKTASVVLGNAFGIPAIAVDTHVKRLSNLIGLSKNTNPDKIEADLKALLPEDYWTNSSHWLQAHGRRVCIARRPKCEDCIIASYCDYFIGGKK